MNALDGLVQPDARSCGAACLVAFQALRDPAYAASLRADHGEWAAAVLRTHREVTGLRDTGQDGTGAALPWPRAIGTPPWAVARRLGALTDDRWTTRLLRVGDRGSTLAAVDERLAAGTPVPLYVGSRWLPRHVVLAVEARGDSWGVYDPARGRVVGVGLAEVAAGELTTLGWTVPWCAVLPG